MLKEGVYVWTGGLLCVTEQVIEGKQASKSRDGYNWVSFFFSPFLSFGKQRCACQRGANKNTIGAADKEKKKGGDSRNQFLQTPILNDG